MKVTYDSKTDTLTVILRSDVQVAESDENNPGVILDYDEAGSLISLEVLDTSQRVTEARTIEFQTTDAEPLAASRWVTFRSSPNRPDR